MASRGRRVGLSVGYSVAVGGALLASLAVVNGMLPLLYLGMVCLGIGNSGAQLARYAAADLFAPERRGFVVGAMVWGGTIGAGIGAAAGHAAAGMSRSDLKDLGELLDAGTSGLIVVAAADVAGRVDAAITRAKKRAKGRLQADVDALKKEIDRIEV